MEISSLCGLSTSLGHAINLGCGWLPGAYGVTLAETHSSGDMRPKEARGKTKQQAKRTQLVLQQQQQAARPQF